MPPSPYLQVTTTGDDREALERLARLLVAERLAACVQLTGPVQSHYFWEGRTESAVEWQLQAKTREDLQATVFELIATHHSYQVPQLVAVRLEHVSTAYGNWIDESLKRPD
jgi:periplasmic divalent cation tolerance protein